jgi:hypothetical protein
MKTITQKVSDVLGTESEKYASSDYMKKLVKANEHFKTLVAKGIATKRGNHLITLAEAIKKRLVINSK